MLESRPKDALVKLVKTVETLETVETVEKDKVKRSKEPPARSRGPEDL